MAQQIPPPAKGMSPRDYYGFLTQQGVPGWAAYDSVRNYYGTPQQAQDDAAEDAQPGTGYQLGQVGGYVGGALVGREIVTGGENIRGLFNSKNPSQGMTTDPSMATPTGISATSGGSGTATGSNLPAVDSGFNWQTPDQFQYTPEGNVTIDTPAGQQTMPPSMASDTGFLSGVNWGAVANGTVSLLQAYQAYNSYKSGDKLGAGVAGAGAITSGAAAASSAGAGGSTTAAVGAWAPYAGIAAGLYGGYQTAQAIGDSAAGSQRNRAGIVGGATSGAALGGGVGTLILPGVGTAIGAGIGAVVGGLAGGIGSWTGSKKGKAQFMRDKVRDVLQEGGVLNQDYQGTLADGTQYNFGDDGKSMKWKEIDKIAAANPKSWSQTVGLASAIGNAYGFTRVGQEGKPNKNADISAWYGKAAVSNAGDDPEIAKQNIRHFAKQQGITFDQIKSKLDQGLADNMLTQDQYNVQLQYARDLTDNLYTPQELQQMQQGQSMAPTNTNKMGTYKPGQSLEQVADAARGRSTPDTPIPKKPGTSSNQQAATEMLQSLAPKPAPVQWSKEAQQRELTRRLQRQRR
jgi:hypothetical protein